MIKTIIAAGYRLTPQPAEKTDVQPIFSGMPLQGMGLVMPCDCPDAIRALRSSAVGDCKFNDGGRFT
jgi:hypothetical protein